MRPCPHCNENTPTPGDCLCSGCRVKWDARCVKMEASKQKRRATMAVRHPHRQQPIHAHLFWQQRAQATVAEARKRGLLPELDGSIACSDCDKPAKQYDHRDYSRALDVEPVCRSCNVRRGTAKWPQPSDYSFKRIEHK